MYCLFLFVNVNVYLFMRSAGLSVCLSAYNLRVRVAMDGNIQAVFSSVCPFRKTSERI